MGTFSTRVCVFRGKLFPPMEEVASPQGGGRKELRFRWAEENLPRGKLLPPRGEAGRSLQVTISPIAGHEKRIVQYFLIFS